MQYMCVIGVLLSVKLVSESKFRPPPQQLVEKLIDSGVAAIVTVVRCHWISSQAERHRVQCWIHHMEKNQAVCKSH